MKKTVREKLMAMILALAMTISLVPAVTINAAAADEQFTLAPGGTYYFDLSSKLSDIKYDGTATINTALPDTSLKWVPFTYAGTVSAYSRAAAGVSTDSNVTASSRSLFVSDYALNTNVSWDGLNSKGLIFGDAGGNYTANGIIFNLRSLSMGSVSNGQSGDAVRGVPQSNEWDQVLNKNNSYIKYQSGVFCWGQDTLSTNGSMRVGRSWGFIRYFGSNVSTHRAGGDDGFRPVLEVLNAGALGSDGIKTVTYDMGGNGKIGSTGGSLTQAAVVYTGALTLPAVTEANGFYYTGTVQEGMTLGWLDSSGNLYAAGTSPSLPTGTTLTAGYGVTGVSVTPSPVEIEKGTSRQFAATVSGSGTYSHAVNWTVAGASSSGTTIDASGLLAITADETANTLTVKAASVQTESKFGTAAVTVIVTDTTPPTISPTSCDYDLSAPANVTTAITWNSSVSVTDVVYSVSPDTTPYTLESDDYGISEDTLTIKNSFFSGLLITSDAALEFVITFNTGATAALTVNVVDSYTRSDDADLRSLWVNGTPVSGFDPDDIEYDVEISFGATSATVTATANDSNAQIIITQASSLPGSATVTVTAENGTTTKTYTISMTITPPAFVPIMGITGVPTTATAGTDLTLSGTVTPDDATNQTIVWSVKTAGTSGATISGNTLSTTAAGTVTVTATITNGLTASSDYTQDFDITVNATPVNAAAISPEAVYYDLAAPNNVSTNIDWNSAKTVVDLVYGTTSLTTPDAYVVTGSALTIKSDYIDSLGLSEGDTAEFEISFDVGNSATFTVYIENNPTLSDNADLSDLIVGGSTVTGFDPSDEEYDVELPYNTLPGSAAALVGATAADSFASIDITQVSSFPGSATVEVTAQDGTPKTYTIYFTLAAAPNVPVESITVTGTGGAESVQVGGTLQMLANVLPANATNDSVTWSISGSGADISASGLLTATAEGSVTVRAAANDSSGVYGEKVITITTPVTTYTINASAGSGGGISPSGAVSVTSGGSQTFTITPNSGYRINAVTVDGTGQGAISTYTFTNVTATHTITATFTYTGGGGGGGASTTPSTPEYKAGVDAGNGSDTTLPVTVDKNSGRASVDVGTVSNLMSGGQTTIITIPSVPDVDTYTLGVPVPNLTTPDEQGEIAFKTDNGSVTVPSNMLTGAPGISGSKAQVSIGQGNKDNLPEDVKSAIGDKPLIQLTLSIDGKHTNWSNPDAPVTVSIPYTPTVAELTNSESIVIWYIDGSGNAVTVPNGHYDSATGTVTFTTTHFSDYAVGYNKVSFNDVSANAWYNDAVSFIAARGITGGMGNGNYSPDEKLTRGEFIVMLMKAYSIVPDESATENFSDAGSTYYTSYLATAKRLGISSGVGKNMYAPGKEITRQEMFTLLYNVLKAVGQLPQGDSGKSPSSFSDAGQIASWARDAMALLVETGTIGGNNGMLTPTSATTRAEMAQVVYNLLAK
jgi:hypothetical protein